MLDFIEQRERPFQMLNFALGALQGVPYDQRTISLEEGQQFLQQPSIYGQTIGINGNLEVYMLWVGEYNGTKIIWNIKYKYE